jgi:gentisate 1,2-dioxygenase
MRRLRDVSGLPAAGTLDPWEPTLIARAEIESDVERLAAIPRPENGRHASIFVHPRATAPGWGLAPGIRVTMSVLKPAERTAPIRHDSTQVHICIRGSGMTEIAGRSIVCRQFDAWNAPSSQIYMHFNDGIGLQARLPYSNAPLLEMPNIHVADDVPLLGLAAVRDPGEDAAE